MVDSSGIDGGNLQIMKGGQTRVTGKKILTAPMRVVVSCVTFETVKVSKPILHLRAEKVYLIHYVSKNVEAKPSVYLEFYNEVVRQLKEGGIRDDCILDINDVPVFRFKDVLRTLLSTLQKERELGNEVYVNVSAGSTEFVAAATIASMMIEGVKPFTVHTRKYKISEEDEVRAAFFEDTVILEDGREVRRSLPIGQSKAVAEPDELPTFRIDMPPRELVIALREWRLKKERREGTKYTVMIQRLKEMGIWSYDPEKEKKYRARDKLAEGKVLQSEKMYYSRHYIDGWISHGWVDGKEGRGRDLTITEAGINVTDTFYID